jgi:hypothetical protein
MTDGSYTQITSNILVGHKAHYTTGNHSGIYADPLTIVPAIAIKSKWGQLGVYHHYRADCPYSGATTYWKR